MSVPAVTFWQPRAASRGEVDAASRGVAAGHTRCSCGVAMRLLGLSLGLLLTPSVAAAQVFTMPTRAGSPRENEPGGVSGSLRPTQPIGRRDCADEEWSFVVNYAGLSGATRLEYWVGVDMMACAMAQNRHPVSSGTPRCWPIQQSPSLTFLNPTTPLSYTVRIKSRYLISPLTGNCETVDTTQGLVGTNYITLLASPPSDNNIVGTYAVSYDIEAPQTPTDVTLSAGEGAVNVRWSYAGATTSTDADGGTTSAVPRDLQGFWLLCDPPPNAAPTDAGVSEAGVDAGLRLDVETDGDGTSATCGTTGFESLNPNDEAQFARYRCSDLLGVTATRGSATGLTNGVAYRVAVVAQDLAGNRSALGLPTTCVRPQPVTDFWESYRAAGGTAEPISCAARPGARASGALVALGLGSLLIAAHRRTRRRG